MLSLLLIVVLASMLCLPVSAAGNPFTDVYSSEYYYTPVLWAVENKVTTGLDTNRFGPDEVCSRAQIVTFLYRALANN